MFGLCLIGILLKLQQLFWNNFDDLVILMNENQDLPQLLAAIVIYILLIQLGIA